MRTDAPSTPGANEALSEPEGGAATTPYSRPLYRYYVLAVLTVVYVFNFVDRQLLVILQEPIKAELNLSDTQLGLLTGFAFALFYVICGIPIARWADKGNRRSIIAISLTIWSVMTAMCGLAANYAHLLLARIGVGVGEAGGSRGGPEMSPQVRPKPQITARTSFDIHPDKIKPKSAPNQPPSEVQDPQTTAR